MKAVLATTGDFNALAVGVFACVLATTLVITRWAAKRTHSATEFYAAAAASPAAPMASPRRATTSPPRRSSATPA